MRGGPESNVGPVGLESGRSVEHESEISDRLACTNALEDPRHPRVETLGCSPVWRHVGGVAGGRVPDASKDLRRSTPEAPETALLAGAGVVLLAGGASPGGGPDVATANLDDMR